MGVETPCEGLKLHVARGVTTLEVEIIHAVLNFDGQFGSRGQVKIPQSVKIKCDKYYNQTYLSNSIIV